VQMTDMSDGVVQVVYSPDGVSSSSIVATHKRSLQGHVK
jgi:hypothetical protein